MAIEKILTHKNGVAEYIITSVEDLKELVDVEVGSRAKLLSPTEVKDYIYRGVWTKVEEVEREDSYDDNELVSIIDDISGEIRDNAAESVNEYHKNLDSLVDCSVTEFEGRDIMINPSIEGKTKNVVVKGETYQNLLNNFSISDEYSKYITANGNTIKWTKTEVTTSGINIKYHNSLAQLNRAYTLIFYIYKNTLQKEGLEGSYNVAKFNIVSYNDGCYHIPINKTGLVKVKLIQPTTIPSDGKPYLEVFKDSVGEFEISYPILLEGDFTNDDKIPSQFEGIVGVGDKSKNLFNPNTQRYDNRWIDDTGVDSPNDGGLGFFDGIKLKKNTTYTINKLGTNTRLFYYLGDVFVGRSDLFTDKITFTTSNFDTIKIGYRLFGSSINVDFDKIQLEEGSIATEYQPYYDGHKIEILSNSKNLFNVKEFAEKESDYYSLNEKGNLVSLKLDDRVNSFKYPIKVKPNTNYTLSTQGVTSFRVYSTVADNTHSDGNFTRTLLLTKDKVSNVTFSSGNYDSIYIKFVERANYPKEIPNIQLEESLVQTSYESYKEDKIQILLDEPLMKLPSGVCDILEQRDDGVYLVKRVGKTVLDGSEGWIQTGLSVTGYAGFYVSDFIDSVLITKPNIICDKLPCRTNDDWIYLLKEQFIFANYKNIGIRIKDDILSENNVTNFKAWLESNPITVYYELATPIETKLDIPTVNVTTFKDVTHIYTTNKVQPIINVTLDTTNISKDANQYFSIENNKNFILPNMDDIENNSIKELNLYMDIKGEYALTFPSDIKWASNVINLNKVDYMSILLKYIKVNDVGLWLGNTRGIDKEG